MKTIFLFFAIVSTVSAETHEEHRIRLDKELKVRNEQIQKENVQQKQEFYLREELQKDRRAVQKLYLDVQKLKAKDAAANPSPKPVVVKPIVTVKNPVITPKK